MEWFEEWFDSKYYHVLYKNRNDNEAKSFIDYLLTEIDLAKGSKVLDLACGKGRHSQYLSTLGYDVKGVDLSKNSIEEAKKLKGNNLSFEVKDMRESFAKNEFNLVANLFTSFGYFDSLSDNIKVLRNIENMMTENGYFVIDFMNVDKVIRTLKVEGDIEIDGIDFKITRKIENGNIIKDIHINDNGSQFHFQEKVQALTIDNFKELINKTDLVIEHFYGDYKLSNFDADVSDRLIIVGTKW